MSMSLKEILQSMTPEQREKTFPGLTDVTLTHLMSLSDEEIPAALRQLAEAQGAAFRARREAEEEARRARQEAEKEARRAQIKAEVEARRARMEARRAQREAEEAEEDRIPEELLQPEAQGERRWYDRITCGLTPEGRANLKELRQRRKAGDRHVDQKLVRYLEQLEKMRLTVPESFRTQVDPRAFYRHLAEFCREHDIPEEIASRVVPTLVDYMETGHMRPILFVGEKGCGKTTAVRLLVEEALHLPTEVIKVPQTAGSHGMTGDCGTYVSADVGAIAKARLKADSLLVAYLFDEIDKAPAPSNRGSIEDQLLSVTDESCSEILDNYLETTLVGLEHCPMFMTANDLNLVSPILADRCTVIRFPNANANRIKAISRKYVDKKMHSKLYQLVEMDYKVMDRHIDSLVGRGVTSLRKHQQLIESVLDNALNEALIQEAEGVVSITEKMFDQAEEAVLGAVKRNVGF